MPTCKSTVQSANGRQPDSGETKQTEKRQDFLIFVLRINAPSDTHMTKIPEHRTYELSDYRLSMKETRPEQAQDLINYTHRDEYFVFGVVEQGSCRLEIDVRELRCPQGTIVVLLPEQVHTFLLAERLKGYMLAVDPVFVDETTWLIFERYALDSEPVPLEEPQRDELSRLHTLLKKRMDAAPADETERAVIRHLAGAMVAIIAGVLQHRAGLRSTNPRMIGLTLEFKTLLKQFVHISRSPAFYAERMHVSAAYLNEAVRTTTGLSATRNIRNEIVIRAKRMLAHSRTDIQEIARELGFEDCAYFSRLFSSVTHVSPSEFRKRYPG